MASFLTAVDNISGVENGMYAYMVCNHLAEVYSEWSKRYSSRDKNSAWNAVIVSSKNAPIMMLPA